MSNNVPINLEKFDNKDYQFPKHLKLLNSKLIEASLTAKRVIVSLPPRHGKSELISKYFPAWYLMNFPEKRLMLIMSSNKSAANYGRKVRDLVDKYSPYYKSKVILNESSQSVSEFAFQNYKGEFYAVGAGAKNIVGKGADFMIIDDPISDFQQVISPSQRDKLFDWFQADIFNRLEPNGSIFIVMQRWHVDDIVGRLLNSKTGWEYISIPAIANSNDVLCRIKGEALWPERYPVDVLNSIKNQVGEFWFNSKYQQEPQVKGDALFPEYYFKYTEMPSDFSHKFIAYDTAFKDNESSDYTGYCVLGVKDGLIYIIDSGQKKLQFPKLQKLVIENNNKYKPDAVIIEDKASGQSLIQVLKNISTVKIKAVQAKDSKFARASEATYLFDTDKIFFVGDNEELINQLKTFPYSEHDDILDAFVYGVNFAKKYINADTYYF